MTIGGQRTLHLPGSRALILRRPGRYRGRDRSRAEDQDELDSDAPKTERAPRTAARGRPRRLVFMPPRGLQCRRIDSPASLECRAGQRRRARMFSTHPRSVNQPVARRKITVIHTIAQINSANITAALP